MTEENKKEMAFQEARAHNEDSRQEIQISQLYDSVAKRTIKDCVFTDFFGRKENLIRLYRTLHPEDIAVSEEDLEEITIYNVLVDGLYNDLGFRVGDRQIILVEAQSTWSVNIIVRSMFYLSVTYQRYIDEKGIDLYRNKRMQLPKPELYVLYTGDRKTHPEEITLKNEFFDGQDVALDIKIKMLYGTGEDDVISQYVSFTRVFDEQRRRYGSTRKAVLETIRICKDQNLLKEYLEEHEMEAKSMMITLYDDAQIMKNHDADLTRTVTERVTKRVTKSVTKRVTERVTKESNLKSIKNLMQRLLLTEEEAMDALDIPEEERSRYKELLKTQ